MVTERHVRHFLMCGVLCGVFAAMPALCAAQDTAASASADKSETKRQAEQGGFNPFGALRDFFGRVLPAQQTMPASEPVPAASPVPVPAPAATVFLATDTDRARLLRPCLGRNTTVIATSQV